MHKPIFILTCDPSDDLENYIQEYLMDHDGMDWFQGLVKSERWPSYKYFDKIRKLDDPKVKKLINKMLKSTKKEINFWLKKGQKEMEEGKEELGWILSSFHIASGNSVAHLFDNTNWSQGAIVSRRGLNDVLKNAKKNKREIYLKGYDIHY